MNQPILIFAAIAIVVFLLLGSDATVSIGWLRSSIVWLALFGIGGVVGYFYLVSRGESQGSSGPEPTSNDSDGKTGVASLPDSR